MGTMFRKWMLNTKIIKWWYRHFLGYELIVAIAFSFAFHYVLVQLRLEQTVLQCIYDVRESFFGSISAIIGTLLGFVITGISILVATDNDSEPLKRLKTSRHYKDIFTVYISATRFLSLGLILSIFALIQIGPSNGNVFFIQFYLVVFVIISSLFRVGRCVWVLENIIAIKLDAITRKS